LNATTRIEHQRGVVAALGPQRVDLVLQMLERLDLTPMPTISRCTLIGR
jgi:hypothetical protein